MAASPIHPDARRHGIEASDTRACHGLVSRFRRSYPFAARARTNVGTKGTLATNDSSVALDLTFLRMTRGNAGRNVKSATLEHDPAKLQTFRIRSCIETEA